MFLQSSAPLCDSDSIMEKAFSKIIEKVNEWQNRPLDAIYPIVFMDATVQKIRIDRVVKNIAAYIMLGVTLEGKKEIIGIWIGENDNKTGTVLSLLEIEYSILSDGLSVMLC